jgi:hypothetical protein
MFGDHRIFGGDSNTEVGDSGSGTDLSDVVITQYRALRDLGRPLKWR